MYKSRQGYNVLIAEKPEMLGYDIYIYLKNGDEILMAKPLKDLEFVKHEKYVKGKPTLCLYGSQRYILQELSEAINEIGIRPEEESITKGKLIAIEKHLEDMRKIVFKKLIILEGKDEENNN